MVVLVDNTPIERTVSVFGTGHEIEGIPGEYINTFQINDGELVFHVFIK